MKAIPTLKEIIEGKLSVKPVTRDIVKEATDWLVNQIKTLDHEFHVHYNLKDFYGYSRVELRRVIEGKQVSLVVKIAEIRGEPFVFAGIRESDSATLQFAYSGDISDDTTAEFLLHYIADFVLSGRPEEERGTD